MRIVNPYLQQNSLHSPCPWGPSVGRTGHEWKTGPKRCPARAWRTNVPLGRSHRITPTNMHAPAPPLMLSTHGDVICPTTGQFPFPHALSPRLLPAPLNNAPIMCHSVPRPQGECHHMILDTSFVQPLLHSQIRTTEQQLHLAHQANVMIGTAKSRIVQPNRHHGTMLQNSLLAAEKQEVSFGRTGLAHQRSSSKFQFQQSNSL